MPGSCGLASLSSKTSFQKLSKFGKRVNSQDMTLIYRLDSYNEAINVAFAVGKKVGKAVTRNKVKRRLKSIFWEFSASLPYGDYLLIVRPAAAEKSFSELRSDLEMILPLLGQCGDTNVRLKK